MFANLVFKAVVKFFCVNPPSPTDYPQQEELRGYRAAGLLLPDNQGAFRGPSEGIRWLRLRAPCDYAALQHARYLANDQRAPR